MNDFKYEGSELELFAGANNWKAYWSSQIKTFIRGDVLEVGAGIGSNTLILDHSGDNRWMCLEPDPHLLIRLVRLLESTSNGRLYEPVCGTLRSLSNQQFDSIIYIDVLEHIDDDREELHQATLHLRPGGHLIVLAPAHQCLFSPFDASIGHFRRYNRSMLRRISPSGLELELCKYIDSVGLIASTANLLLLRQSMPTKAQIRFWDQCIVPVSRVVDPFFRFKIGKSIIAVWRKP
jgi:SAM-dependent methyltransferase